MATAINDFIQGIIMLAGIVVVIAAVLNGQGGFINAVSEMAQIPVMWQSQRDSRARLPRSSDRIR